MGCGSSSSNSVPQLRATATDPPAEATGVRLRREIRATLADPIDPATCGPSTLVLAAADGTPVAGAVRCDRARNEVIFEPTTNLRPNERHTATVTFPAGRAAEHILSSGSYSWSFTTGDVATIEPIYAFAGSNGADPKGSLTLAAVSGGTLLFGRTTFGGTSWSSSSPSDSPGGGVIFALPLDGSLPSPCASPAASVATYSFTSAASGITSGYQPHHDAMKLVGATLYGTALYDGAISTNGAGNGAIFSVDVGTFAANPTSAYAALHDFAGSPTDGATSHSTFDVASDGTTTVLYGATAAGGVCDGCTSCGDCSQCSACDDGTIDCLDVTSGSYGGPIFSFDGSGGADQHGRPTVVNYTTSTGSPATMLFGITKKGGTSDLGVIYAFSPPATCAAGMTGTYAVLHSFTGAPGDGATTDHGNLTFDPAAIAPSATCSGNAPAVTLYGMTSCGGSGTHTDSGACSSTSGPGSGAGVIFSLTVTLPDPPALPEPCGAVQILHDFGGGQVPDLAASSGDVADGYGPYGSLLLLNGCLYGMTKNGGASAAQSGSGGGGTIFMLSIASSCTASSADSGYGLLASFDDPSASTTGSSPIDNLIASSDGSTLYGLTQAGGCADPSSAQNPSFGTVFSIAAQP